MNNLKIKIFALLSTFFVGLASYYLCCHLGNFSSEIEHPNNESEHISASLPIDYEKQSDLRLISPCKTSNPYKSSVKAKNTISAGVVNHLVECGNLPEHFSSAKDFSGRVAVRVLIDEFGEVQSAYILKGHQLPDRDILRVARQTRFKALVLGGEPVKARGVLVYKFDKNKVGL